MSAPRNPYEALIAWFAENHVAANLLMVILLAGGLFQAMTIKKEIQPQVETNLINIVVPYLGAAPEEVEEGVCVKVEEAIQDLQGIEEIVCRAQEGSGVVTVEVNPEYEVLEVMDNVKIRIDGISTFPEETEKPVISRTEIEQPVMWISVFGDVDERTLKEFAQRVRDEIVALPKVTRAEVVGGRPYEISIELSEFALEKYDLTFDEVARAVRRNSLDLPGGKIQSAGGDILLRTKGQAYRGGEFAEIVVRSNPDGTRVKLDDVATIRDGFAEVERYAQHNGQPAISIRVLSVGNQSELDISAAVREYIEEKRATLPPGIGVDSWADITYYLQGRLDMMLQNLASGAVLVFLVLTLFLRFKLAFWVMVGVPIAFMGTFFLMPTLDVTVNMLSLFGFILVLGIVVDDAIIIGESAYTMIRRDGHSTENVVKGALRVAVPATFGVLTTVVAFLPILLVGGISGAFFEAIGWVVILCLVFSLVESKLILPAHLAHMKIVRFRDLPESDRLRDRWQRGLMRFQRRFSEGLRHFVSDVYRPLLERAVRNRYTTLATFLGALILSIGLLMSGLVRTVFFPDFTADFVQVTLEMNEGTPAQSTHRALDYLQQTLAEVDQEIAAESDLESGAVVDTVFAFARNDLSGQLVVELAKNENAIVSAEEVLDRWREKTGEIPGARQLTFGGATGPQTGPSIAFQLVGKDTDALSRAADELEAKIREYDGVHDVRNSFEGGSREIKLKLKPEAEVLGLTLEAMARQVRQGFYGEEVQRIQRGPNEVKVMVRYPREFRSSVGSLENMRVRTPAGEAVPFGSVAELEFSESPTVLRRFNRQRAISVTAEVDKDRVEPGPINTEIRETFLPELLGRYPGVSYRLDGGSAENERVQENLAKGALLALFLIYALMAIPLRSYAQPFLIMMVIPFGIIGAIVGHLLLGIPVSMLSFFGIIALSGVVVNDSLILVDFVNRERREGGVGVVEAVLDGAVQRFRAILLTSLTTFLGLVPIVFFERSLQAQIVVPMA
ncbi:MAG: efflux RND transporter permease subunit, partial [Xanthomonadales bacterium]|nr:efflux RND transporter permease subunit [Xanthomonadales bacterium]